MQSTLDDARSGSSLTKVISKDTLRGIGGKVPKFIYAYCRLDHFCLFVMLSPPPARGWVVCAPPPTEVAFSLVFSPPFSSNPFSFSFFHPGYPIERAPV